MPIDPDVAIGAPVGERVVLVDLERRAALPPRHRRRLPPGRQPDPDALRWTADGASLQVLPSFGVVAPTFHETDPPPLDLPGCDINLSQVVHGSQAIAVHRAAADVRLRDRPHDAHRRLGQGQGRGDLAGGRRDRPTSGEELWTIRSSIFVRGEGGWGGDRGAVRAGRAARPGARRRHDVRRHAAAGAALPALRRPQPAARRPRLRQGGRLPGADPARAVLLRHRAARAHRRRCSAATRPGSAASRSSSPAWSSPARRSGCGAGRRTAGSSARPRSPATASATDGAPCSATSCWPSADAQSLTKAATSSTKPSGSSTHGK